MNIHWGRIALGGLLTEVAIFAVVLPLNMIRPSLTYYAVPVLVTAAAFVFGRWVARPLPATFVLHGVLTAVVSGLLYVALTVSMGASVPMLYHLSHGLRLLGGVAGGASAAKARRSLP